MLRGRSLFVVHVVVGLAAVPASAQQGPPRVRREIPGLDFRADGVWRRQARAVRALRHGLLAGRNFPALNAPLVSGAGAPLSPGAPLASNAAVSGVLRVPAVLFKFKNTPAAQLRTLTQYNQVLFATSPTGASAGRPYTYTSFYAQLSNGLLSVQGATYGYAALDSNEVTYTGVAGTCSGNPFETADCNGLFSSNAVSRMQKGLVEALRKLDNRVDWTQYDGDGDGYVDLIAFIQPAIDGACGPAGNNHLWSHRFFLLTPYTTHSVNRQGVRIKVADYILESGVGGNDGCDATQIMPIGTVAHETGHGFGLPDLYDTDDNSQGVGDYSLMGTGNYTSPSSPSRMDAWSLNELGWVTVVPLATAGPYQLGAAPTADTALYIPVSGSNVRGEYFLLENREPVQSDSAMIRYHCKVWYASATPPSSCGGGLMVWHVDSLQIARHGIDLDNRVNAGPIHGLALLEADGRFNLDADPNTSCVGPAIGCSDRGDAGDLYPGTTGQTTVAGSTLPTNLLNTGQCSGFRIDSIAQIVPGGAVRFVLTSGPGVDSLVIATLPRLPDAQWGYTYSRLLQGACGTSTYTWSLDSGALPPGLALSGAGVVSGPAVDTGTYTFAARVKSGTDSARRVFTLRVGEPVLPLQVVLALGFQGPQPASDNQRRYLDLQGNGNGTFDIGDVLRWLARTGNPAASAVPMRQGGRRH
jgi:M6 family metalloprotease-like protein